MNFKFIIITLILTSLFLTGCGGKNGNDQNSGAKITYYCPMHPEVTSDKPSVCPICNMDLVPKSDDEGSDMAKMDTKLKLSDSKLLIANVQTTTVGIHKFEFRINALGKLDYAEGARKVISARSNGRIEKLFADKTGVFVKTGTALYEVYSTDIIKAANDFLTLSGNKDFNSDVKLKENAKLKLINLGLSADQIEEISKTGEVKNSYKILSPYSGYITSKNIVEGAYYNEGSILYEITDISKVWNRIELFEKDLQFVKQGSDVETTLESHPGKVFKSRINFISFQVESANRTVEIRSELTNNQSELKPNMFTRNSILISLGDAIAIPSTAVIKTGNGSYVWLKRDKNTFEKVSVGTGAEFNGLTRILTGVKLGNELVTSGNYLLDSESELISGNKPETHRLTDNTKNTSAGAAENVELNVSGKTFNLFCPVLGDEVSDKAPKVRYKGMVIGFCCKGCDKKFAADPEFYMKNLSPDGKKFTGKKED